MVCPMMKILLLVLLLLASFFSTSVSHPISMAFILMLSCFLVSVLLMKITSSWFFYLLVLMFLGGVMVVITYMVSLASNEKTFFSYGSNFSAPFIALLSVIFLFDFQKMGVASSSSLFVGPLYESGAAQSLTFSFSMLLLALISVVKLMKLEEGPLIKRL